MISIKFDNDYIKETKKKIINFVSRSNASVSKISVNLSLFKNFVIAPNNLTNVSVKYTDFENNIPAKIEIGSGFIELKDGGAYVIPELEDILQYNLIYQLLKGSTLNYEYMDDKPIGVLFDQYDEGIRDAMAKCFAENISGYVESDSNDKYSFNKKNTKMLIAIIGERYAINTFFRHDDSFGMMIYSLSTKTELLKEINKLMILINRLITTLETDKTIKKNDIVLKKAISLYQHRLVNLILCELYIPYINSVGLDNRKVVRDEILKGFLGSNYANLKLNSSNKESYYWASLINNSVPINNKLKDEEVRNIKDRVNEEDADNLHNIYVLEKNDKTKNSVKEFFVYELKNKIVIKNANKKLINEPHLIEEVLSYAYINCTPKDELKKVEDGITKLCSIKKVFKCSLKKDSLSNKMLVAGIIQLARKNGYELSIIGNINDGFVEFEVK